MKNYIENVEHGVQIRIDCADVNMKIYDELISYLDNHADVKPLKKVATFETPISDYQYKEILFSVLFDEMVDETFVFVGKEYNYKEIENLIQKFDFS